MKRILLTVVSTTFLFVFSVHAVEPSSIVAEGAIESKSGGFKFPDGSIQTTATNASCVEGSSIRSIGPEGTFSCEEDSDTTYNAGIGLALLGNTFINLHPDPSNIIWVSKSGAEFSSIQTAIDSITDAANGNSYLIKVGPGSYGEQVTLKPYVIVEGSGEGLTFIQYPSDCELGAGTLNGSNYAEAHHLTVESIVEDPSAHSCAVRNEGASPKLTNLTAVSSGGLISTAIHNLNSSPQMNDVTAVSGPATNGSYGVHNLGSSPRMNRVYARGSDSGMNNFGIHNQSSQANSSLPEMEHITAEASGDNSINTGITVGSLGHVTLNNTSIRVSGNDSVNYGIDISGASLSLRDTKILTQGANGSSIGIRLTNAESEITAQFVTIDAVNSGSIGTQTIGFDAGADTSSELFNVYFTASGGGNVSVGVIASLGESGDMRISHSHISASAASARGISVENSPSDSLKIINSEIHGSTNSIFNISTANVSIGSTQLSNPIGTAGSGYSFVCVTSFDENFNSLGEGCL